MRPTFTALLIAAALPFGAIAASIRESADQAYEALLRHYWQQDRRDFVGTGNYWFYAHSIDVAALALKRNPTQLNRDRLVELISAQRSRSFFQGAHVYFDDENWMALSLIRAAEASGNKVYLDQAAAIFDDVMKRGSEGRSEGVWWNYEHKLVATAANAGAALTAALIAQTPGRGQYLAFARKTYAYWRRQMVAPDGEQVYDSFEGSTIGKTAFSYDQGLMIGAALELYRATHQRSYLTEARAYAEYMLKHMRSREGVMIEEFCGANRAGCLASKDVAQFKGIAVRYLVELARELPHDKPLRAYLTRTGEALSSEAVFDRRLRQIAYEWDGSESPANGTYQTTNSGALALGALATLSK